MLYYRCRCGKREAWGSIPPDPCFGCEACGTTLDTHPEMHRTPKPHDFSYIQRIKVDSGEATITRCRYCLQTRDEFEKEWSSQKEFDVEIDGVRWRFDWAARRRDYPKGWLSDDGTVFVIPLGIGTFSAEYADADGAAEFFDCGESYETKEDAARAGIGIKMAQGRNR